MIIKCCPRYAGPLVGWCPTHKWVPYQAGDGELKMPPNPEKSTAVRVHDKDCTMGEDHPGPCGPPEAVAVPESPPVDREDPLKSSLKASVAALQAQLKELQEAAAGVVAEIPCRASARLRTAEEALKKLLP
jgi:hypothetical protein